MPKPSISLKILIIAGLLLGQCQAKADDALIAQQPSQVPAQVAVTPTSIEQDIFEKDFQKKPEQKKFYQDKRLWIAGGICALVVGVFAYKHTRKKLFQPQINEYRAQQVFCNDVKELLVLEMIKNAESQEVLIKNIQNLALVNTEFRDILRKQKIRKQFWAQKKKLPKRIPTPADKAKESLYNGFKVATPVVVKIAKDPEFWRLMVNVALLAHK